MITTALRCPRCPSDQPDVGTLTAHLVDAHLLHAAAALKEAREVAAGVTTPPEMERPPASRAEVLADPFGLDRNGIKKHTTEGDTMPKGQRREPCSDCGAKGSRHFASCSLFGSGEKPAAKKKRRTGGGTRTKPARKPRPVAEGNGAIADNGVKTHALALVGELLALRERLDEKIKHVRELAEIL